MADASRLFGPLARERSDVLDRLGLEPGGYAVATVHRLANVTEDDRLRRIVEGLRRVEGRLVFPAHPRTRASLARLGLDLPTILPLGYLDFAALASQARVILTDSGGLQKEAYWYRVPCVTMRPNTEWVDTVEAGGNVLVDDDPDAIARAAANARFPDDAPQLYGDGYAGERVAAALYPVRP
jgi:UDP-N-acetylglucosamine 2-epimerase